MGVRTNNPKRRNAMIFIKADGSDVPKEQTITVDHFQQVFTVVIRSMSRVHPDTLKDLIQRKYEVLEVDVNKEIGIIK